MKQLQVRKWLRRIGLPIVALTIVVSIASSASFSALAQSTSKQLSTNFTLVGFSGFPVTFTVEFIRDDGSEWRPDEEGTLTEAEPQAILRQYDDPQLTGGRGSVRVNSSGEVGAVVQIQARDGQVPTSGAYNGASSGSEQAVVPLVSRRGSSLSGATNSQITIQNTGSSNTNVEIDFYDLSGNKLGHVASGISLASGQAEEYDLDEDNNLPVPFFGSAVVRSDGGQIAVVSNFFTGPDAMQTYEGFVAGNPTAASEDAVAQGSTSWAVPLFTSQLPNTLNTPVTVQNISGGEIGPGGVVLNCTPSPGFSPSFTLDNPNAIPDRVSYAFNPADDPNNDFPDNWVGSCVVTSGSSATVAFVQLRFVEQGRAASHQAIPLEGNNTTQISIPLWARRLPNSFASAVTIINLSDQSNNVQLVYSAGDGAPGGLTCSANFAETIPGNGNLIENHRVPDGVQDAVPEVDETCFGSLTVTSNDARPIAAFVQLDFLAQNGDPYMAHNAFDVE